jgi:photosystem II stability/assembly factor-like uncharacterized protein
MKKLVILTILAFSISMSNAQWVKTNGPKAPNYSTMSFAKSGSNIFAATAGKGMFLTTDNGNNWTAINNGLTDTFVSSIVLSGSNIFIGTYNNGVFLSTNNGNSWIAVNSGLTYKDVNALVINGSNIFAGTMPGGVFLSTNNGGSWTSVNNGFPYLTPTRSLAVSGSKIFAGTYLKGMYLSTNNGSSWTEINNGLSSSITVNAIAISGSYIFAGTEGNGLYLSTNNGSSWSSLTNLSSIFVNSIVCSGKNIFVGNVDGTGVSMSSNYGSTWTDANTGFSTTPIIYTLAILGSDIYAGLDDGTVWKRPLSEMGVGINDLESVNSNFKLYPNPNNGKFRIEFDNKQINKVSLKINNLLGERIFEISDFNPKISNDIDISNLPKGVYFVKINDGVRINTEKFVIQ